jgi:hypothetical protein
MLAAFQKFRPFSCLNRYYSRCRATSHIFLHRKYNTPRTLPSSSLRSLHTYLLVRPVCFIIQWIFTKERKEAAAGFFRLCRRRSKEASLSVMFLRWHTTWIPSGVFRCTLHDYIAQYMLRLLTQAEHWSHSCFRSCSIHQVGAVSLPVRQHASA